MGSQPVKKTVVLDTCAWLWIATGHVRITSQVQMKLEKAEWLVSAISVWEVAMLVSKKRFELDRPIKKWIDDALINCPYLNLAPLLPAIAVESCALIDYPHADPADRIIIATAIYYKAAIATGDKRIMDYCHAIHLPVIPL